MPESTGRLPRKVLHLMNGAGGGAALSTLGLIESLRERGVASCVVCDDAGTELERERLSDAVGGEIAFTPLYWWNKKIRSRTWKRPALEALQWVKTGFRAGSIRQIVSAVGRWNAELIHTNTILTPEGGHAARLLGISHVWHLRELIGPGQPFQLPLTDVALAKYLLAHASVVVANSSTSAAALEAVLPADRLRVVHNGVDTDRFAHIPRRQGDRVIIGMVANLTSRVKKHQLFAAAARLAPGAQYRLYGHAPTEGSDAYADEVRAACAAAGVQIMGFVDATALLGELDVLVHTADGESFGRTVVEAMAVGLPVVGVAGGGVGETVVHQETGLLAAPDDVEALAAHFRRLIGDESLRRSLGDAGKRRAQSQYSMAACGERMAQAYRLALSTPVASGSTTFSLLGAFS